MTRAMIREKYGLRIEACLMKKQRLMRMQSKGRLKTLKPCGMKIILAILIKYGHGNPERSKKEVLRGN